MQLIKRQKGFTLVELVIVLAIAALILAAVLLAVGGAQRTQRDSNRKGLASRTATALENYASNNNGSYTGFAGGNYFNGILDPDTNAAPTAGTSSGAPGSATQGIHYALNSICGTGAQAGTAVAAGASNRNYAVTYYSENAGTSQCIDNK